MYQDEKKNEEISKEKYLIMKERASKEEKFNSRLLKLHKEREILFNNRKSEQKNNDNDYYKKLK